MRVVRLSGHQSFHWGGRPNSSGPWSGQQHAPGPAPMTIRSERTNAGVAAVALRAKP